MRSIAKLAIALFTLSLAAGCGGGGGSSPTLSDDELDRINNDPRVIRLERIVERTDTLMTTAVHADATLSVGGETAHEHIVSRVSCAGTRCTSDLGEILTLNNLLNPTIDIDLTAAALTSREGFDAIDTSGRIDLSDTLPGLTLSAFPDTKTFGAWGQHGYASVGIIDGPISGRYDGASFSGDLAYTISFVVGDVAGTNPAGVGGASWQGLAQAVSTRTYSERQGTATISIPDLANPTVTVGINIDGNAIGSAAWSDMPLTAGHFQAGAQDRDFVNGHFFGSDHSETYGVFDTSAYAGIFAARKQ